MDVRRKTVLCYGDSNTWGYSLKQPEDESYIERYDENTRWTGVLQQLLGEGYRVVEEGLNARTSIWDDPAWPQRNGLKYLKPCLDTHAPVDLVVLMLGTNDLKLRICAHVPDIARAIGVLIETIQMSKDGIKGAAPEILLVSPILISESIMETNKDIIDELGGLDAHARSLEFAPYYEEKARRYGCHFLNAADFAQAAHDSIHLDEQNHRKLAQALCEKIRRIYTPA